MLAAMVPGIVAGVLAVALVAGIFAVRRYAGRRVEVRTPLVVDESPLTAIDRVERAASRIRGYAFERKEREIVIFRHHEGPLAFFESPDAWLANVTMDLLHVTAEREDGFTRVLVKGRSEPRVINRVRRALSRAASLLVVLLDDNRGVVPAEAERVRGGDPDVRLARLVRDVVEVTVRIGVLVVDRRRQDAVLHGQGREDRLDRAGRAETVTRRALRRRDRDPGGDVLADRELDHPRLARVADRCRGAVGVDVVDLRGVDARVGERHRHRARRALARRVGVGDVRRVRGEAVADQL